MVRGTEGQQLLIKQYFVFGNGGWSQVPVVCIIEEKPHGLLHRDRLDRFKAPLAFPSSDAIDGSVPTNEIQRAFYGLAGQRPSNVNRTPATTPGTRSVWAGLEMATEQSQHKKANGTYWERAILLLSLSALLLMQ